MGAKVKTRSLREHRNTYRWRRARSCHTVLFPEADTPTRRRMFGRFERIVVHSERGREALAEFGVPDGKLRVIPHPVFASEPERRDDGRTVLALGMVRPYKQIEHSAAAARAAGARLLVAGEAVGPPPALDGAELRLGYLSPPELERALGDSTVAVFPYRAELDQSGALLQALGAGVPAVVYDVGGLGETVANYGAGRVVPADDVVALGNAVRELLDDESALAEARAGARRAREALSWDASAQAHLDLYGELA